MNVYGDLLHSLKGVESDTIHLQHTGPVFSTNSGMNSLVRKFREVFVMRVIVNIAVESFLCSSSNGHLLALATIMEKWLMMIDSSLDSMIVMSRKKVQIAKLMHLTDTHRSLIKTLFFIVGNDSILSIFQNGTLADFDHLALHLYRSDEYWSRFPSGYDLVEHIGNLFHGAQSSYSNIFCKGSLQLFPSQCSLSSRVSTEFGRVVLLYSIFQHVSKPIYLENSEYADENEVAKSLEGIDLELLWIGNSSVDTYLHNMMEIVESTAPIQAIVNAKLSELSIKKNFEVSEVHSNPLDFFQPEIVHAADFISNKLKSKSVKRGKVTTAFQNNIRELTQPVVSSNTVKLQNLPATLPMPRSLMSADEIQRSDENRKRNEVIAQEGIEKAQKASSKDRPHVSDITIDNDNTISNTEGTTIITSLVGTKKAVDESAVAESKKYLQAKYEKLQLEMDRRKLKAVWQIRRLKRIRESRKYLSDLYADHTCIQFIQVIVDSPSKQSTVLQTFAGESESKGEPRSGKKHSKKNPKSDQSKLDTLLFSNPADNTVQGREIPTESTNLAPQQEPQSAVVNFKSSSESKAAGPTISTPVQAESNKLSSTSDSRTTVAGEGIAIPENDYGVIVPYNPIIELESSHPKDNLVPVDNNGKVPLTQFLHNLRSSLRLTGLEEALTADQFLQQLCSSLPVSLLMCGISYELVDVAHNSKMSHQDLHRLISTEGSISIEQLVLVVLSAQIVPRYDGFVSFFQAMSLAVQRAEKQTFRKANVQIARNLVVRQNLVRHLLALQEIFLMSPTRCGSFLFDVSLFLVDQAWNRLSGRFKSKNIRLASRSSALPAHQREDLWSNLAFTEALRDASSRLHVDWQTHFKQARFYFQRQQTDTAQDRYFSALVETHRLWPMFANHRLRSLVIDFQVPAPLYMFFSKEIMQNIGSFTQRYLEIGQLVAVFRIVAMEMRRCKYLAADRQGTPRMVHVQLFEMLHVLQSFLRYFNDRHMTLTQRYYLALQESVQLGAHKLLQLMLRYSTEIYLASFSATEAERNLQTVDFSDFSMNPNVLLRICLDHILHEVRLFGTYILTYINEDSEDVTIEDLSEKLLACGTKIRAYRQHIFDLCDEVIDADLKDHIRYLRYYLGN